MICESLDHARHIFRRLADYPYIVGDTETVPKKRYLDEWIRKNGKKKNKEALVLGRMQMVLFSMCCKGEAYSFPSNLVSGEYCTIHDYLELPEFKRLIKKLWIWHNANYDLNVFDEEADIKFKKFWDTAIGVWLANPAKKVSLKDRAPLYGRHIHKTDTIDFTKVSDIGVYAEEDVIQTDEQYQMQMFGFIARPKYLFHVGPNGKTVKTKNPLPSGKIVIPKEDLGDFEKLWMKFHELPYLRTTIKAEKIGFPFNVKKNTVIHKKIEKRKKKYLRRIYRAAGRKLNLRSPQQKAALFAKMGIHSPNKSRKTGNPSYNAGALVKIQMAGGHKIISDLQTFTALQTLSRFSDPKAGLPHFVNDRGRIRATAKTTGAVTGRGSSSNPNLTQIPAAKDQFGFKDCFEAPKGKGLICLDHSQLELRVMAILSGEMRMAVILNDPTRDIHGEMAADADVDRDPTAKQLNFLLQFAGTAWALAEKLTIEGHPTTPEQAQVWVDRYNQVRPDVVAYRKSLLYDHEQEGFVRLLTGADVGLRGFGGIR
jgi:DNA polymerase I-like protein with 3'-5' exonuclease and polymerase domains